MNEYDFQLHLVLSTIARGAHRLEEIARECGGLYPLELRVLLDDLVKQGQVRLSKKGYHLTLFNKVGAGFAQSGILSDHLPILPEPHPHDCDWRFDPATSQYLARIILQESSPSGVVLLLGAPSVFIEMACSRNVPHTILLDWSSELTDYMIRFFLPDTFRLVNHDLLSGSLWQSHWPVDVVLCDPPWYPEHYAAFLTQAAYTARVGAAVIVSLLPLNTRPDAVADRWQIFENAQQLGLHLQTIEPGAIRYQTPIFESASLHATDFDLKSDWRSSDIAIFRKTSEPSRDVVEKLLAATATTDKQEWAEVLLGRYKIKLRGPFNDYLESPTLISIEKGDILPTVSRRYPGRKLIDLWLWDNRVFAAKGKAAFLAALYTLAGRPRSHLSSSISDANHNRALDILSQVIGPSDYPMKMSDAKSAMIAH
ncbi:MAG: hypothetical protein HS114_00625 [Anaerolineales bacterium]|nr:hypothetical protein [Anaerolineales bacterium]